MRGWSLGYELIRTYVRFAFWLTHKRIVVTGKHYIPEGKPIIFAANHQNALMDPLAITCTNRLQMVWLARADLFKTKIASSILNYFKMLPIYRIRDGKDNLSNNDHIFALVTDILESKQSVALFPEAAHSGRRQMLPHKKAIPRIALEAEAKNNFELDLQIVPVGIYYSHYWWFNRTLIVQYGAPINIDKYREDYTANPQKAMLSLRDEIHDRILPLTLNISSQNNYEEYENIRQVAGKAFSATNSFSGNKTLRQYLSDKELIAKIEQLETNFPEKFEALLEECTRYFRLVSENGMSDEQVVLAQNHSFLRMIGKICMAFAAFPLFAFGFVFNAVPFFVPRAVLHRKVKNITFLSTFNFVAGLILFPFFYLMEAAIIGTVTHSWAIGLVAFILMPFAGKYAWKILQFYHQIVAELKLLTSTKTSREKLFQAMKQREEFVNQIIANSNA
jgi:1-acyl-sn-glycerol-3-phosphate acyltransferase